MPGTRSSFHQQLDEIHRDLLRLAGRVIEVVGRGTDARLDVDLAGAARATVREDSRLGPGR